MKNCKRAIKYFTIMEYDKEQEYLRSMHQKGWKFTGVTFPCIYRFESCEPCDVVYQLDYNAEGINNLSEYIQMFRDCGWEFICNFAGYSYFRKPVSEMQDEEEIFNDDNSKLEMLKRVFKGRMIPLLIIFACIICPQLLLQATTPTTAGNIIFITYCILFILYVSIFVSTWIHYNRLKNRNR